MVSSKGVQRQPSRGMTAPFDGASLQNTSGALEEKREREVVPTTEDIPTLEDAIRSGVPGMIEGVLGRLPKEEAIRELTAVRGVVHHKETPIMRAARSGSVAMFTAVRQSMLRMDDAQMLKALVARDKDEEDIYAHEGDAQHTALHMEDGETCAESHDSEMLLTLVAAEAGSEDIFDEVVKLLDRKDAIAGLLGSEKEAIRLLTAAARGGSISIFRRVMEAADQRMELDHLPEYGLQLVFGAARGGSLEVFGSVQKMLGDPASDVVKARSFTGCTTLMAAAGSGSVDVVSSVGELLAAYSDRNEVKDMIRANNKEGYSCLLTAAYSGRTEVVTKISEIMKEYLAEDEVQRMTIAPCLTGDTALMVAATVPDGLFFRKVFEILDKHLSKPQMCNMLKAEGRGSWNIMMEAAQHGRRGVIEAVTDVLRKELKPHEVSRMFLSQDDDGETVLMHSARSGKAGAVETVVEAMQIHLKANEVTRIMKARSRNGYNVLILATCIGERGAFLSVKKIISEKLGDKMVKMIQARCGGATVLTEAIEWGRVSAVKAAAELIAHLSEPEAREMVRWGCKTDDRCPTVFMSAALADGSTEAVEAVRTLAYKYLKDNEVVELMKADIVGYTVFRVVTEFVVDRANVKAVLKMMELLTKDQVMELATFGDGRGRTLLVLAVECGILENFKLIAEFLRSKLDANQVAPMEQELVLRTMLRLLRKKNAAYCTALMLAAQKQSEAPEIYRTLVELVEECKVATADQGSEAQDSVSEVGVSARSQPFSTDSGGETRTLDKAGISLQRCSEDCSDDERDEGNVGKPLPPPQGRVKYPTRRQAEAGPDGNADGVSSGDSSNRRKPQRVSDMSTVSEAISSGMAPAIENVLSRMTREHAVKELCGPANARVTPILRAARDSDAMFLAVLKPMKDRLTESQMAAALAGGTDAIGFHTAKKKRFSDVVTTCEEQQPYLSSDEFMRALILIAAQGRRKEVLDAALNQFPGVRRSDSHLRDLHQAPEDAENLFLAAARGGSIDIFDYISSALPAKASTLRKNLGGAVGKRLLYEAVKGGSVSMIQKVLDTLGDKEIEMILANKLSASTILIRAAQSGRFDVVKQAMELAKIKSIKELLFHTVNMTADNRHDTVLTAVASSGKADAIKALMNTVERVLLPAQVAAMIQAKTSTGGTVLTNAVGSGSAKAIKAVKDAMNKSLKPEQVSSMVQDVDVNGNNIFAQAILSGSTEGLWAVADVMDETLEEKEVSAIIQSLGNWPPVRASTGNGLSILALAAGTGSKQMFEAVLDILFENLPTPEGWLPSRDQLWRLGVDYAILITFRAFFADAYEAKHPTLCTPILRMVEATNRPGGSILQLCVKTGVRGVFEAAVDAIDGLPGEHVRRMIIPEGLSGESVLADAILRGSAEVVEATMEMMEDRLQVNSEEMRGIIQRSDAKGRKILTMAVISQDKKMFQVVTDILDRHLADPQIFWMISAIDGDGQTLMAWASRQTSDEFHRTVAYVRRKTSSAQVLRMMRKKDEHGKTILMAAASSGKRQTIEAVMEYVEAQIQNSAKLLELIAPERKKASILCEAARSGNRGAVEAVMSILLTKLSGSKVVKELATAFEFCVEEVSAALVESTCTGIREPAVVADRLEDIAIFLEYGAVPRKHAVKKLITSFENDPDRLNDCFQRAVSSASNPFIPGMTLSVSLSETALILVEGDRRALLALQREVDRLLLEILERLPQTVAGLINKDDDCTAMLEPETLTNFPNDFVGPLGLALQQREHMKKFCTTPLVLDFMSRKFTLGLPKLRSKVYRPGEQEGRSSEEDRKNLLRANGLIPDQPRGKVGSMIHGCGSDKACHLPNVLPGAKFIIAGVVSNPSRYYDVPLLRMALGFVVYLAMLVLFSSSVLVQDYGELNTGEYALAVYVAASMVTEISEVWRGYKRYLQDPWNVLDVVALLFLAGGFVTRAMDNGEVWGQYLYALSAPALFSRILFFGLVLPAQGPMIQVLLSMTRELVTFGVVMVVVMLGFAMSFFTLFQDLESETYGTAWLEIFKAIFGDVELFNEVSGQPVDGVATAVLVLYMTVMTIMLLNLLIAVLSTAHANVQQSVQKEFEISKARMIGHYRQVVKQDFLPAPFNLVQRAVSLPFELARQASACRAGAVPLPSELSRQASACRAVKRSVGIAVFSLVLGPVALAATFVLGVLSVPKVIHRTWNKDAYKERHLLTRVGLVFGFVACSCLALPACLAALWLKEAVQAIWRVLCSPCGGVADSESKPRSSYHTVDDNLQRPPGGLSVSRLREYLENPMNDPKVRRDEETRCATVEHIKLLRDRLEDKGDQRLKPLWGELDRLGAGVSDLDGKVEEMHRNISEKLDGRIDEMHRNISEKLDGRIDEMNRMFTSFAEKLEAMKGDVEPKLD